MHEEDVMDAYVSNRGLFDDLFAAYQVLLEQMNRKERPEDAGCDDGRSEVMHAS